MSRSDFVSACGGFSRRQYLVAVGGAAVLAGCNDSTDTGAPTETGAPTTTPTETLVIPGDSTATVSPTPAKTATETQGPPQTPRSAATKTSAPQPPSIGGGGANTLSSTTTPTATQTVTSTQTPMLGRDSLSQQVSHTPSRLWRPTQVSSGMTRGDWSSRTVLDSNSRRQIMTDIELRNENGKIVGYDTETGQKVSVDFEEIATDALDAEGYTRQNVRDRHLWSTIGESVEGFDNAAEWTVVNGRSPRKPPTCTRGRRRSDCKRPVIRSVSARSSPRRSTSRTKGCR